MKNMTTSGMRRGLSILLMLVMLLQYLPAGSLAVGEAQNDSTFLSFSNWTITSGTWDAGTGVTGNGAQITPKGSGAVLRSDPVGVTPGEKLRAGMWVKIPSGGEATLYLLTYTDAAAKKSAGDPILLDRKTAGAHFVELAADVTVPANVLSVRLQLSTGASGTYTADDAYIRMYTDLPEFSGVMGDGYGIKGQWSLFYPLGYAVGDWAEQKDQTRDPSSFNYAQIVQDGKDDKGAVRFLRAGVYEHIGIAIGSNLVVGEKYTVKMWVKGNAASTYGGLQLYAHNDPVIATFGSKGTCPDPDKWYEITLPITATRNHFYVYMNGGANACDVLMDHVQVLDSEGNDMLGGCGSFSGSGTVTLGSHNRVLNNGFEDTEYSYLPLADFNGSFEGASQEDGDLDWVLNTESTDKLKIALDDNGKHLQVTKVGSDSALQGPAVELEPGGTYQVAMDLKTTGTAAVGGVYRDAAGNEVGHWEPDLLCETEQWSRIEGFATVPEDAVSFQIRIQFSGTAGDTMAVDNVAIHPCRVDEAPKETQPDTQPDTPPESTLVPITIDTEKKVSAYSCTYDEWVPMYPQGQPDGGTWGAWDATHYGEIAAEGKNNPGSLHLVSIPGKNTGVAINAGMTPGQQYTLSFWAKGTSNSGRVLAMYANGDQAIIGASSELTAGWSQYTISFTATISQLNILAVDWGNTSIYLDNITLKDAGGNDLLAGKGDFYKESTGSGNEQEENNSVLITDPSALDTSRMCNAYAGSAENCWMPMYPQGQPDGGTWGAWDSAHYGEIAAEGKNDPGSLHLISIPGKNTGVAINAGMTPGQQYTLSFWAKGTSNSGRVLGMYANGDPTIIGASSELTAGWSQYTISFTATISQLNILAVDWGNTSIYLDNITLKDAGGNDLLAGKGDFCKKSTGSGNEQEENNSVLIMDPSTLDTSRMCNAYAGSAENCWMPMYPTGSPDGGVWDAWNSAHYGEIAAEGKNDPGSLHLISIPGKNTGVAINAGMTPGQQYTLSFWAKGTSNSGRVLAMYANGDQAIIGAFSELTAGWSQYTISFTAGISQLNILAADWGNTSIYLDNITLKDAGGNDLLAGKGDFCMADPNPGETEPEETEPEETEPEETEQVILDTENVASHGVAYLDRWAKFFPTGTPGGTWVQWDDTHYGEIVAEGYKDAGALHLKSAPAKNAGVSIDVPMTSGKTYTLGLWAKGVSNSGKVLAMYGNYDPVIIGTSENLSADWQYYEISITANMSQLTIMAVDWGNTDIYIDNVTLTDEQGTDLLANRGDFCIRKAGEPKPDKSVNLLSSGDFENVAALYIPGWIIKGTAVMDGDTLTLKKGTALRSLRYQVEEGQILFAGYNADGGIMALEMGNHDQILSTAEVGQEGLLLSIPAGVKWLRVYYGAMDAPVKVSSIELVDQGDPANLNFELKDPNSAMPMNWTTWTAVNDPSISADRASGAYSVMHQEGTGVDGSNCLNVLLNQDVAENKSANSLTAVVDSVKIAVEPHTTYRFSFWAKMDAQNGCIYPSVRCFQEDGSADGATQWMNGAFATGSSGQWKEYTTTFTTGEHTKYLAFRLEMKASNAGAQFWADRITYKAIGSSLETNLDFELGTEGELPLNWTSYERNYNTDEEGVFGDYEATWTPGSSGDGSAALKVRKLNGNTTEIYVCSTMVKVDPASSYYFGYDAATLNANPGDQIMIMLRQKTETGDSVSDVSKAFYWPTNAYAAGHFNWSKFGAIFETAPDCQYIQIMFCIRSGSGYSAYIDNVELTKTEKIENPNLDFEYSVGKIPLNWEHNGVLAQSTMEVYTENVFSGKQALRVNRVNGEVDCSFIYANKRIPVTPGDKIEVVANISSRNAVSGHFSMYFLGFKEKSGGELISTMYGQERVTNSTDQWSQWDTYEMVWTVPKDVKYLQICMRVGGTCNDMLIDDITVYNYTKSDNVIYQEDFKNPSVTTGLPGGWEKGEITGTGEAKVNGQMSLTGNGESNVEIFTKLYTLKTDYVYTLAADVFTTGTAKGQLIMEAVNWNGTVAGQPVVLDLNTGETDQELKATFESLSAVYYRLILRKTEGNGSVCIKNITLQQTGDPSNGVSWAGKWLTHPDETARIVESPHPFTERHYFFRHEINLDKEIESAQMQITADDKFTLYINGKQVYEESRTGDTWDLPVTVDIAEYLTQGKNIIAIDMYNNIYAYGLLFDGIVKMQDDSSLRFYSTSDTMVAAECYSNNPVPTVNSRWTEYDQKNWFYPEYDISANPLWVHADEYVPHGGGLWGQISFDPTEYSDYKLESNEFTFPTEAITAGDTVTVTAKLKLEKALPTTNSFQVNFWKRNTTTRVCSGTMTIAGGKTTDDWPIGEEFTAEFEMQVPLFLAEGAYTVQFENMVSIVSDFFINNKVGNIKVVQIERELTTTSSVEVRNGKSVMIVNGEEKAPLWFARPERPSLFDEETVVKFAEVGVDTIVSYIFLNNLYGDVWTRDGFVPDLVDSMMLDTLAGNPEAQLIVALDFNAPDWWLEDNPGELAALSDTEVTRTNASFASQKWKEESGAIMLEAIDHMMSQPYANNIIGFKVTGGYTLEWNWWATSGIYTDVGDFSECGINAFRQWLTEKYGTDEALQEAYGNDEITLATAMPPSREQRSDDYLDTVILVQTHPEMMDYELYMAELKADTIEYFSKLVKDHIDDRLIVGTYGGYFFAGGGYEFTTAVTNVFFQRMLQSENIDFIKSPWMYGMREIGDSAQFMGPVDSLDLYGKLWIIEDDSRLNRREMADGQDGRSAVGWTRNYQQSVEQLKRNFSYILSKGMGVSFYNLMWDFFNDDQYYGVIGQMYEEMTLSMGLENESMADVAVFIDGKSHMLIPYEEEVANSVLYVSVYTGQLERLGHIGASYDIYLMDDLADGLVPEHKVNIFLATNMMTEKERAAVDKLKANGNILVFQFTDGISDGMTTDIGLMEDIVEMDLKLISTKRQQIATARVFDNTHWLTEGMNKGQPYGVESYDKMSPVIAVTDSSAVPLAYHSTSSTTDGIPEKQVALAVKEMDDWTCIYSALPNMPESMFRNMLKKTGCHIYTDSGSDVIYANSNYVALHSIFAGERTIKLPGNYTVYDVFNRQIISTDTDSFTVTLSGKETRLFRLTEPETVQVYVGQNAGGTVTNKGLTDLKPGDDLTFTVEAAEGYRLSYLLLDGQKVFLEGNSYTFEDIQESHTVLAHFSPSYGSGEDPADVPEPAPEPQNNWLIPALIGGGAVLLALVAVAAAVVLRRRKKQ